MVSSFLGELAIQRKGEGYKYPLQKCDRCSSLSPETLVSRSTHSALDGNSGQTPEGLLGQPTSSTLQFSIPWCGDSGPEVRRLRSVWKLRGDSGATPRNDLSVPTFAFPQSRQTRAETLARRTGNSGRAETPIQLRTTSAPASTCANIWIHDDIFKDGRRLRP